MPNIGPLEIGIVLIIALVVFGPKRLPELGKSLGRGIQEFKGTIGGESKDETPAAVAQTSTVEGAPVAVAVRPLSETETVTGSRA
jgi:sec-independent protein translocase protein TatA